MNCHDCYKEGVERVAVGACHHCSAGPCGSHIVEVGRAVTTQVSLNRVVELPIKARRFLCGTCRAALGQRR